jgi:hypothetical protein
VIIDVFNHFMPKAYLDRLANLAPGHLAVTAFPRLKPLVDVDARLRLLDQFNDLRQVICLANPPLELIATSAQSGEGTCGLELAKRVAAYPPGSCGRKFGGFRISELGPLLFRGQRNGGHVSITARMHTAAPIVSPVLEGISTRHRQ